MKKLVATAPRVAALVEYEDRAILANEVKIRVRFGAPKHGTEVVDSAPPARLSMKTLTANGRCSLRVRQMRRAALSLANSSLATWWLATLSSAAATLPTTRWATAYAATARSPETVIINAVNNYKLRKMPQGSSWKNAVCYDPAQFAMSGVRDANVRVGDFVVVVGLGAIGQIAIQLAKRAGASVVIGVDPIAYRCDIARRHGADFCLNPIGTDVGKEIKR